MGAGRIVGKLVVAREWGKGEVNSLIARSLIDWCASNGRYEVRSE